MRSLKRYLRGGELFRTKGGDARVYWHLIDDREPGQNGKHGRWYLAVSPRATYGGTDRYEFSLEWSVPSKLGSGIRFSVDDEGRATLGVTLIGSFYLSFEHWRLHKWGERHFALYWDDQAIWFSPFTDTFSERSDDPWWRRTHSFHFATFFLGTYKKLGSRVVEELDTSVHLNDGEFPVHVKVFEETWKRSRWFVRHNLRSEVAMKKPIPIPGKGDNDYDMEDDALFEISCNAPTVAGALGQLYATVMRDRLRAINPRAWVPS